MAAPEYVPGSVAAQPRIYQSPPRRLGSWTNDRPGDFNGPQPTGPGLGAPGPDQGFALRLARRFEGHLYLAEGEHEADAVAGCVTVALRRASLFGRGPTVHDLTIAFAVWGYLGEGDGELVGLRLRLFEEVSHPYQFQQRRAIATAVPDATLRMTPAQVRAQMASDWRPLIEVPELDFVPASSVPPAPAPASAEELPADTPVTGAGALVDHTAGDAPALVGSVAPPELIPVVAQPVPEPVPEPVAEPIPPALPVRSPEPAAAFEAELEELQLPPGTVADLHAEPRVEPAAEPLAELPAEAVVADMQFDGATEPSPQPAAEPAGASAPGSVEPSTDSGDAAILSEATEAQVQGVSEAPDDPDKRQPVKRVPLDPNEVAALARQAKFAFQRQSHHKPKPPREGS